MKVLLQHKASGLYLKDIGITTHDTLEEGVPKVFATGSISDSYADTSGVAGVGV